MIAQIDKQPSCICLRETRWCEAGGLGQNHYNIFRRNIAPITKLNSKIWQKHPNASAMTSSTVPVLLPRCALKLSAMYVKDVSAVYKLFWRRSFWTTLMTIWLILQPVSGFLVPLCPIRRLMTFVTVLVYFFV